jgi:hypothetical protein
MISETEKLIFFIGALLFSIPIGKRLPQVLPEERVASDEELFFQLLAPEPEPPVTDLNPGNETESMPSCKLDQEDLTENEYIYKGLLSSLCVLVVSLLVETLIRYLLQRYWNKNREDNLRQAIREHFSAEVKDVTDSMKMLADKTDKLETQMELTLKAMCAGMVEEGLRKTIAQNSGDGVKKRSLSGTSKRKALCGRRPVTKVH